VGFAILYLLFLIGIVIYLAFFFIKGPDRWCEQCNTWSNMKPSSFSCEKCGHSNKRRGGCPKCGWYARFENRFVGRVGPIWQRMDFNNSIMIYRETWDCPKHGNYQCDVPASESREH
jgi:hypothetical protein